jgi:2,4-dienoyl-CoA reductase-like NADH-dependent reductase (Old Yellow Enzyme family)
MSVRGNQRHLRPAFAAASFSRGLLDLCLKIENYSIPRAGHLLSSTGNSMSASVTDSIDRARPMLFQPFKINGLTLKNRLVVPPMVHYRAAPGNTCGSFHNVHLGRYALGGFGLVFVEATAVEAVGLINEHDLGIWNDAQVQSFKPLIAFMKGEKTAIGIQLAHGGRKASSQRAMDGMGPLTAQEIEAGAKVRQPVGPTSEPVAQGWLTPRQLTADECRAMVRTWAQAARNAVKAGFDVIEIHTAHGYLLASFLSPISNTRNDDYGGDRAGRMRLPLEIVEAVRREMPDTMPLFVRVSAVDGAEDGWNLDDTVAFAQELKARGVDVIDCSSGGISGSATAAQVPRGLGFQVPCAERVRKEVAIATMAVGIILEAQQAEAILENGRADLIAIGGNPNSIPTSRNTGPTISASTGSSRTGLPNMDGGSRSAFEPSSASPHRPESSSGRHEVSITSF